MNRFGSATRSSARENPSRLPAGRQKLVLIYPRVKYHNNLDSVTYFQLAAENCALYLQCFALAEMRLIAELERARQAGREENSLYVVSDCDETLIDNSAYNVWLMSTGRDFHDDSWSQWCSTQEALATPGAVDFARFVIEHGATMVYVSSRFERDRQSTAQNLRALGFPLSESGSDPESTLLFLSGTVIDGKPTKKGEQLALLRRRFGFDPLLQLGDNLSDHDPERYSTRVPHDQRLARSLQDARRWGHDCIVFPNPVYGSWRNSLGRADEQPPVPFQSAPVREPLDQAPKLELLRPWKPPEG